MKISDVSSFSQIISNRCAFPVRIDTCAGEDGAGITISGSLEGGTLQLNLYDNRAFAAFTQKSKPFDPMTFLDDTTTAEIMTHKDLRAFIDTICGVSYEMTMAV